MIIRMIIRFVIFINSRYHRDKFFRVVIHTYTLLWTRTSLMPNDLVSNINNALCIIFSLMYTWG